MAEHWCKEHKMAFFKKGKMKGFAHPICDEDGEPTGEWCNKPKPENAPLPDQMSKDGWATKDANTRKSIERQTSLKCAIDLCLGDKIKLEQIRPLAEKFESYLGGDKLIEKAKEMGFKEE